MTDPEWGETRYDRRRREQRRDRRLLVGVAVAVLLAVIAAFLLDPVLKDDMREQDPYFESADTTDGSVVTDVTSLVGP